MASKGKVHSTSIISQLIREQHYTVNFFQQFAIFYFNILSELTPSCQTQSCAEKNITTLKGYLQRHSRQKSTWQTSRPLCLNTSCWYPWNINNVALYFVQPLTQMNAITPVIITQVTQPSGNKGQLASTRDRNVQRQACEKQTCGQERVTTLKLTEHAWLRTVWYRQWERRSGQDSRWSATDKGCFYTGTSGSWHRHIHYSQHETPMGRSSIPPHTTSTSSVPNTKPFQWQNCNTKGTSQTQNTCRCYSFQSRWSSSVLLLHLSGICCLLVCEIVPLWV